MGFGTVRLTSIVAANAQGAIGVGGKLPWRIPSDLKFFKDMTAGNVVIMGRKTFDSLGGKPLPNRLNIVLSHYNLFEHQENLRSVFSITEALLFADKNTSKNGDAFVIGGSITYHQFAPLVDRYLITLVDKAVPNADSFLDEGMFGTESDWNINLVAEYSKSLSDEAFFEILELSAKTDRPARQRSALLSRFAPQAPRRSRVVAPKSECRFLASLV